MTPTGDWSSCKATKVHLQEWKEKTWSKVEAGDLVVFPDGMTCATW